MAKLGVSSKSARRKAALAQSSNSSLRDESLLEANASTLFTTIEELVKGEEETARDQHSWLLTYSDLATVILVFFVMLQVISDFNPEKFNTLFNQDMDIPEAPPEPLKEEEIKALELMKNFEDPDETLQLLEKVRSSKELMKLLESMNNSKQIVELHKKIKRDIRRHKIHLSVSAETDKELTMVVIKIRSGLLFKSGSASLSKASYKTIDRIIEIIRPYKNFNVNIQGHTDDRPIKTVQFPSNWELSAIRATSILRYVLESRRIEPARLTATGFGDLLPVDSNESATGRAKNRRVEFILRKIVN